MVTRLGFAQGSKLGIFSIGSAADIANLPTMNTDGKGEADTYEPVCPGSYALLNDGTGGKYILKDTNEWVEEA